MCHLNVCWKGNRIVSSLELCKIITSVTKKQVVFVSFESIYLQSPLNILRLYPLPALTQTSSHHQSFLSTTIQITHRSPYPWCGTVLLLTHSKMSWCLTWRIDSTLLVHAYVRRGNLLFTMGWIWQAIDQWNARYICWKSWVAISGVVERCFEGHMGKHGLDDIRNQRWNIMKNHLRLFILF